MSDATTFIQRYNELVDQLDRTGRNDTETMWLLSSLAARLVTAGRAQSWTDLKQRIDDRSLEELVTTLDGNAEIYDGGGKTRAAFVARLLGASLVAGKIADESLRQRDRLLDGFIDTATIVYLQQHNARNEPQA